MRHFRFVVACSSFVLLVVLAQACGGKQPVRCQTSADCSLGQVCSAGTCQTSAGDAGATGGGSFFLPDSGSAGGSAGGGTGGGSGGGATGSCNPQTCAAGCCDANGICQGGTTRGACGVGGAMCVTCGPGRICQGGMCGNPTGGGSAAGGSAGGGAAGGFVNCGPATCASGCCDVNGLCVAGTTSQACGTAGQICLGCFGGDMCVSGSCMPSTGGGSAGGSTAGGSTAGGSTAGGSTAGGSTAGGSTAGGSTAGGTTAGGSTAGGSTAGGSTAGGSTAGGSTAGGSTAGGSTAGGSTAGGSTAGGAALPGEVCATAESIAGGTLSSPMSVMGTTAGYANNYSTTNQTGCFGAGGRDRVYSVAVAAGARLLANIRSTSALFDPSINLVVGPEAQCSAVPRVCVAGDDLGGSATVNAVRYLNTSGASQTLFVIADSFDTVASGTFRLDVSVDTPTSGDTCESPIALMSGMPRAGEPLSGMGNDYFASSMPSSGCTGVSDGADRAYSTLVGAGETLTVTVVPSAGLDTTINLHGDAAECASRTCQTSSNNAGAGSADTLTWRNSGTTARTMLIVVDSAGTAGGTFTVTATTGTLPGDYCSNTLPPLTSPQTLSSQTLTGYAVDYAQTSASNGCENYSGPDRVHAVTVPARSRLVATSTPTSNLDAVVNLIPGAATACDAMPRICGGSADGFASGSAETAVWDNGTTSPQNVFVVVGGYSAGSSAGTYSLGVNFTTGDHCRSPDVVAGPYPRTYTGETFTGRRKDIFIDSSVSPCRQYSGPDRVYQVTLPARSSPDAGSPRMSFSATASSADLVLNVYNFESTCVANPAVCLAGADSTFSGAESVAVTNPNLVPVTVYVGVSLASGSSGTYNATVTITP